ncbi:MAG: hypothetical protein JW829_17960 [Pirellulales bacterium]|nr:hypothetical protein [Pirellulales bacterium]
MSQPYNRMQVSGFAFPKMDRASRSGPIQWIVSESNIVRGIFLIRVVFIFMLLGTGGCGWMQTPKFHTPSLEHPGTAAEQQYAAIRHDPYPLNDIGPEVLGARPPGFEKPPNEVMRARQGLPWGNWRGHAQ